MADNTIQIEVEFDGKKGFATLNTDAIKAGQDAGDSAAKGFGESFAKTAAKLFVAFEAVKFLGEKVGESFKEAISEASKSQDAINNLNLALNNAGRYSVEASNGFKDFAEELSKNSRLTDEQALSLERLAINFTKTNEQTKLLVKAATDLSAATGIDLDSAVTRLGRTLTGTAVGLNRVVPGFVKMKESALQAGGALKFVEDRFGGTAAAQINTFSGALGLVEKQFNEVVKASAAALVSSPAMIAFLKTLADGFSQLAGFVSRAFSADTIKELILSVITLGQILAAVLTPLERISEIGKVVFVGLKLFVNESIASFAELSLAIDKILVSTGLVSDGIVSTAQNAVDALNATSAQFSNEFNTALTAVGKGTGAKDVQEFLDNLQTSVESAGTSLTTLPEKIKPSAEAIKTVFKEVESFGSYVSAGFIQQVDDAGNAIGAKVVGISINVKKFLVDGIVQGTQAVVKALMAGKNGFTAFANAILGIVGNMLIQIGSSLVAIGLGIDALKVSLATLSGAGAIAAGIALIGIGTLLQGLSSGSAVSGDTGGSVSSGGGVATEPGSPATEQQNPEAIKPGTQVAINVQGNILDRRESGLEIAQVIQDFFDTQDGVIAKA